MFWKKRKNEVFLVTRGRRKELLGVAFGRKDAVEMRFHYDNHLDKRAENEIINVDATKRFR